MKTKSFWQCDTLFSAPRRPIYGEWVNNINKKGEGENTRGIKVEEYSYKETIRPITRKGKSQKLLCSTRANSQTRKEDRGRGL